MEHFLGFAIPGVPYGCTYAIVAVGLVLTYQATGVFNFAFGAQAYTSAFIYTKLVQNVGLPIWLAFLLAVVLLVIAADIGAFFVGRQFGRRKLAPRVSPGKTWEGAVGGLCAVALVAWLGARSFGFSTGLSVGFGCAIGVFSVIGDLTESMFKRAAGLKDSGVILPGHGGILDRIDSATAAAPLYALSLFGSGVIE